MVVMLDSGASHNFMKPDVMSRAKLQIQKQQGLEVLLGMGVSVDGLGVCKEVEFRVAELAFTVDFIAGFG